MPNKIKLRRSYTSGAVPLTTDLETNEVCINYADGRLFVKTPSGTIQAITLGGSGSIPTASASVLGGVKVGAGLTITDGVLSASGGGEDAVLRALFVPPAPTSVTATGGNAQVSLAWTAPTVLAQTPITDYVVQYSSNSGSTWTTFPDGTSTATSATVTGLTNGTSYTFRVAGVNGVGQGPWSAASNSITPSDGDPLWSSVSLLMHFEGSSFVDSGPLALSLTRESNDAQLSTAQFKFGSQSGFWANYTSASNVYTPNSSAFGFGTGDFTIEFWYRYQDTSGTVISIGNEETYVQADNGGQLYVKGVWENQIPGGVPVGQWVHVAICRSAGTTSVYTGGTRRAQISDNTNFGSSAVFRIGRPGGYSPPSQYIDELRVTKAARYSGASITVPTAAFPDS